MIVSVKFDSAVKTATRFLFQDLTKHYRVSGKNWNLYHIPLERSMSLVYYSSNRELF